MISQNKDGASDGSEPAPPPVKRPRTGNKLPSPPMTPC